MPKSYFEMSIWDLPTLHSSNISTRQWRTFCRAMQASSRSQVSLTRSTDSDFFAQSTSTLDTALPPKRVMTRKIWICQPSLKQWKTGGTISRAPITRSRSSATTRISSTSKRPQCSPKARPGRRKTYPLTTSSLNTWNEKRTQQMDHQEDPTMR